MAASIQELKEVVKETLENRGVMGQLKARIRAEVFNALDDHTESRPPLSNENMLINELIREYLEFNKYKYSASTLLAESGQPQTPLDRQFLSNELNIMEDRDTATVPLLYSVVSHFMNQSRSNAQRTPRRNQHQKNWRIDGEEGVNNKNVFNHQKGFVVEGGRH
ncbi:centrosomal protein 20-like [Tubulanus polymorphus]|uniref:centrosomal protein 20-like n=1 Tax=Tubulanus polymorphus TaxID=672921 RepID=UPI003DA3E81C